MTLTPFTFPEAFSPAECDLITHACAQVDASDAGLVRGGQNHNLRRADLVWLDDLPDMDWVSMRLVDVVRDSNRAFGFEIEALSESPQVARYGAEREGHFTWHSDIGDGAFAARRKLTIVVQLSCPSAYEGGALELQPSAHVVTADRAQGSAIAFPAFMLHRVTSVTKGARNSLTIWAHGPGFR